MKKGVKKIRKRFNKKFFRKLRTSIFLNKNRFSMIEVVLLLFITLIFGVFIGYFITFNFKKEISNTNTSNVMKVYDNILNNYYKEVSSEDLDKAAISGIIKYLDDENTMVLSDNVYKDFNEQINGYFCGIGISVIYENNYLKIINVVEDSISDKSGIKVDDIIYEVDGIKVDTEDYVNSIKGVCGTDVQLNIIRGKEYLTFNLKREAISLNSIVSQYFDVNNKYVGYIDIDVFANDSYDLFVSNLKRLEDKNIQSLIIDLRYNPGGVLSSTSKILNIFFDKNTTLYGYKNRNVKTFIKDSTKENRNYPVVILMNDETASSAEIFISAFKENYKNITLIGKTTYGKNTIQTALALTDNYGIKYTVSEWFSSKEKDVKGEGILPDVEVENGSSNFYDDMQLQEAINLLK